MSSKDADITNDDVYDALRNRIAKGEFLAILAAPPCSTFSISRFMHSPTSADDGPPPVRVRKEIRFTRPPIRPTTTPRARACQQYL